MKPTLIITIALALGLALYVLSSGPADEPTEDRRRAVPAGDLATLRIGTFNIENYPRSASQRRGAFDLIDALKLSAVGVQEITRPEVFASHARKALGDNWHFATCENCPIQHVGVLYDGDRLNLLSTASHRDTETYRGGKPAFEARLQSRWDGQLIRLIVVHLKSGGNHMHTRKRQLRGLRAVLERVMDRGEAVIVLGDFNATSADDRHELAELAAATDMFWATREVQCSAYWERRDECLGSALDHILSSVPLTDVAARGPCEEVGCQPGESCPLFFRQVSDHCPVTAVFE